LHESVPGTVNGSGTSSALINALRKMGGKSESTLVGKGVKAAAHVAATVIPGGHAAALAVEHVGGARSSAAAGKALAKAIRETMDPALARRAANENIASKASLASRKALAAAVGRHSATAAASSKGNR